MRFTVVSSLFSVCTSASVTTMLLSVVVPNPDAPSLLLGVFLGVVGPLGAWCMLGVCGAAFIIRAVV
jgi:hypothetical protein